MMYRASSFSFFFFFFFFNEKITDALLYTVNTMTATFKDPISLPGKLSDNNVMIVGLLKKKWLLFFKFTMSLQPN